MAARALHDPTASHSAHGFAALRSREVGYQAYTMLRVAFAVAPIAFGLDKFFNVLVDWPIYLAPWINDIAPGSGQDFMYFVGAVEILAGVLVAIRPKLGRRWSRRGWPGSNPLRSLGSTTWRCATSGCCSAPSPSRGSRSPTTGRPAGDRARPAGP